MYLFKTRVRNVFIISSMYTFYDWISMRDPSKSCDLSNRESILSMICLRRGFDSPPFSASEIKKISYTDLADYYRNKPYLQTFMYSTIMTVSIDFPITRTTLRLCGLVFNNVQK